MTVTGSTLFLQCSRYPEGQRVLTAVADDYADVVLLIEVMQHIDHLERAMASCHG